MKKRTKRLLAMLLASAMILQQGSTVAVLATESEPTSETVTEKTAAAEAETKTPETKAPETQAETKASETTASETQATEAAVNATQTETTTSETTETAAETTGKATEEQTAAPEESETKADAEAETKEAEEKAAEVQAPKTNFTYEDNRVKITAVAQEAAKLPQDAQIHADYMQPGTVAYNEAAAALEAAYASKDVVLSYVFYDIYFTAASVDNGRIEPEAGTVTVSMQFKQPELKPETDAEVQTYDVVHVENGKAQEVPSTVQTTGDGSVASVGFTSGDFSPYAVVMSVEEQDEVATIGLDDVPMMINTDKDIKTFLDSVEFYKGDTKLDSSDGSVEIEPGETYKLELHFSEEADGQQFEMEGDSLEYTYSLPDGFPLKEYSEREFTITGSHEIKGKYKVENGKLIVTINKSDSDNEAGWSEFTAASDVAMDFWFDFKYENEASDQKLEFSDKIEKTITVEKKTSVDVEKKAEYDPTTGTVTYKILVKAKGKCENVKVTDTMSANNEYFIPQEDVTVYTGEDCLKELYPKPNVTFSDDKKSFDLTIPSIPDGETYVVKYTEKVDYSKVNGTLSGWQTTNTVKVKPDNGDEVSKSASVDNVTHNRLEKTHGDLGSVNDGYVEIPWTITINGDRLEEIKGTGTLSVSDTLQDGLEYSGDGLNIVVKDSNGIEQSCTLEWQKDLGINIEEARGWTIEDLLTLLQNHSVTIADQSKSSITINYKTKAKVAGQSGDKTFKNDVVFDGTEASGEATVGGTGEVELEKTVTDQTDAEHKVSWKVKFNVTGTVAPCDLVDTLPSVNSHDVNYSNWKYLYDVLDKSSVQVDGLCEGEGYDLIPISGEGVDESGESTISGYTFRFYHMEGINKVYGLTAHDEKTTHEIVITYDTITNNTWVQNADIFKDQGEAYKHTNTVKSGDKESGDSATIHQKTVKKCEVKNSGRGYYHFDQPMPDTVEIDDIVYPLYYFTIMVTGVSVDTFTVEDTFDGAQLKLYKKFTPSLFSGDPSNGYSKGGDVSYTEETGKITFTVTGVPKDPDNHNNYYHYYEVIYCMIPASMEARQKLLNGSEFTNTADFAGHKDSVNVKWDYHPLKKTLEVEPGSSADKRTASFKIDYNPSKVDFLPGDDQITITDSMKNLRFLPETLKVKANGVLLSDEDYSYDFNESGDLVIILPHGDGKHLEITYDAKVIGEAGSEVEISNTVRITGCDEEESVNKKVTLNTGGGGSYSNTSITLYKYMKGFMRRPLSGAEYRLEVKGSGGDSWKIVKKKDSDEPYIFSTDAQGKIALSDVLLYEETDTTLTTGKEYRLIEVKAPDGYTLDPTPIPFRISSSGDIGDGIYQKGDTIYVDNAKENFHIVKKDEEKDDDGNDVLLEGAEFSLYETLADAQSEAGIAIKTARTDAEGIASFADLEAGTYYLKETAAPEGYDLPVPNPIYRVNIDVEGNVTTSSGEGFVEIPSFVENSGTITNSKSEEKGSLTVTKAVAGDKAPATEEEYEVEITTDSEVNLNTNGVVVTGAVADSVHKEAKRISFKIMAGGSVTVTGLPQATYTVTETVASGATYTASYVVDEGSSKKTAPQVTFNTDTTDATVAITNDYGNKTGSLTVTKAVVGNKAPTTEEEYEVQIATTADVNLSTTDVAVTGAVAGSVEQEAKKINFKIKNNGRVTVTGLPQATYTVTETSASGATYTASYVVDKGSSTETAPQVTFNTDKTDATVAITNDYGSDVGKLLVKKVVTGTKAPNPAVPYDVTVATTDTGIDLSASSVTVTGAVEGSVSKGKQQITFKIMGGKTVTIDKLPLGTYTVTETVSGTTYTASYKVDNATTPSPAVTFSNTGTKKSEATVEITNDYGNKTGSLQIKKNVTVNGKETTGTEADGTYTFKVKKNDETAEKTVSITIENGKSGTVTVDNLEPGTYTVTEVTDGLSAKNIHLVGTNGVTVTVVDSETATTVPTAEFTNNKVKLEIDKVDATTGKSLAGAEFVIIRNGLPEGETFTWSWRTDGQPHDITGLASGEYTLKETKAPDGYTLADPIDFTVNADGKIVVNGEEVYSFVMKDTKNKVSILKVDESGKALAGATLIVKDKDGKVVAGPWTTDGNAHEITGLAPGTYTLSELEAPKGYQVSENVSFEITGNETKDAVITVTMTDKKIVETKRSLKVTKHLHLDGITSDIMVRAATYYVALFTDAARTQRVTDVKKIVFNNENTSSATFDNLAAGVTYYVGETDENGTVIPAGRISENMIYYPTYDDNATFTFEGKKAKEEGLAEFTNVYVEWPNYFYLSGQLTVTKQVLLGGEECDSDDTFYARIFNDAGLTDPVSDEVLVLDMAGGSRTSVTVTNLPIGDKPGSSRKYYVAETDEYGNPLDPEAVTEYTISVDKSEVTLDASSGTPEVVITNDFHEEESEFESESEVDEKKTAPKTGEDTDYAKYLFLMTLSAGTCAILFEEKRRKNRTRQ